MTDFFIKRLRAFGFAFSGLHQAFMAEAHLQIHAVIALCAIALGLYVSLPLSEWFWVLSCITLVITLELVNSAIEKLCDKLVPQQDLKIKYVKDVMAGAVLLACIFAVVIGVLIFWPHIKMMFS